MKGTISFGKNEITIDIELSNNNVLSICGNIWNNKHSDIIMGGQCLDELQEFLSNDRTFQKLYRWWKLYHLNDMHAGTKKQEQKLKEKFGGINANLYDEQCEYLKSVGLLYDKGYKFGSGWLKQDILKRDLLEIEKFIKEIE